MKQTVASSSCTTCTDHHRSIYNSKTFSKPMPFKNAAGNTRIKSIHKPPLPKLSEQPTAPDSLAPFCTTPALHVFLHAPIQYAFHLHRTEHGFRLFGFELLCTYPYPIKHGSLCLKAKPQVCRCGLPGTMTFCKEFSKRIELQ